MGATYVRITIEEYHAGGVRGAFRERSGAYLRLPSAAAAERLKLGIRDLAEDSLASEWTLDERRSVLLAMRARSAREQAEFEAEVEALREARAAELDAMGVARLDYGDEPDALAKRGGT